jgi:hypothetical protein
VRSAPGPALCCARHLPPLYCDLPPLYCARHTHGDEWHEWAHCHCSHCSHSRTLPIRVCLRAQLRHVWSQVRHVRSQGELAALELAHVCERAQVPWHERLYVCVTVTVKAQLRCHQVDSVR